MGEREVLTKAPSREFNSKILFPGQESEECISGMGTLKSLLQSVWLGILVQAKSSPSVMAAVKD